MLIKKTIGLRCDVDFEIGLTRGVPFLLDCLAQYGIKATFYVTMGPDGFRKHTHRLRSKSYRQRVRRMDPLGILRKFGPIYLARQFLGLAGDVGRSHPEVLRRIQDAGHELGVHGYDHFWWAENVLTAAQDKLRAEFQLALASFCSAAGRAPSAWASPNWRCSAASLALTDEQGFLYGADTRGAEPFFPVMESYVGSTPQLPISLPCLHEISDYLNTTDPKKVCAEFLTKVRPGYNVWCIHDYYEGILRRDVFELVLQKLVGSGWNLVPMISLAGNLDRKALPLVRILQASTRGGRGAVSCHEGYAQRGISS